MAFRPALPLAFLLALLAGCARPDPRTVRITGDLPGSINGWRGKIEDQITRAEWKEFDAMLQEVRWSLRPMGTAANDAATTEALVKRVQGFTFGDVLRLGYETKLRRLEPLRAELKEAIDTNALLVTQDVESEIHLRRYRSDQQERLAALDAEIGSARQRFAELGGQWKAAAGERPAETLRDTAPARLTRAEALKEIDELIAKRRDMAAFNYGAWPVKFDENGTQLPADLQAEFQRRGEVAEASGRQIIAVRLKGKWRIFDAVSDMPKFPPAVAGNLSAADLQQVGAKWTRLQAEVWARKEDKEGEKTEK
jgi:hypothetical protein